MASLAGVWMCSQYSCKKEVAVATQSGKSRNITAKIGPQNQEDMQYLPDDF